MGDIEAIQNIFKKKLGFYEKYIVPDKGNAGLFSQLPFISKDELLASQKKFPPYGNFTDKSLDVSQIYRTSGTSAEPLLLTFTAGDIDRITDIGAECFSFTGMGALGNNEVVINCLNLSMWAGGFFDAQSMMKTGVQVVNFGTGNTTELLKLVRSFANDFKVSIHCTPSYLPILKSRLVEEFDLIPEELGLWALYLGAEGGLQNHEYRCGLQKEWGCHVYNANYGMSEVCSIMASANDENILRFSPLFLSSYYCEIKLEDGSVVDLGVLRENNEGELVVTSLFKESQPLLRYETKENIRIVKNDTTGIYFEVSGRKDDMLVFKGVNIFPEQFRSIITNFPALTGNYTVEVTKKNEIVTFVNLICEINVGNDCTDELLKRKLMKGIRDELTITCSINFVYQLPSIGNKVRLLNIIKD